MKLSSSAFQEGGMIPQVYTCDGEDKSPPLSWSEVPDGTKGYALIADDPDAPGRVFVHWVAYAIPRDVDHFDEGLPRKNVLANGAIQGTTSFGRLGYGGPCPPSGTHRYYFKLYALDKETTLNPGAQKEEVLMHIRDHVLAEVHLMGKYSRG